MSSTIIYQRLKKFNLGFTDSELKKMTSYFKVLSSGKGTKYNAMKVSYKDNKYDSFSEAIYAFLLDKMLKNKSIKSYERQVKYKLENMQGKLTMRYVADFVVIGNSGKEYIIDVKGRLLPENKVKYAYFRYVYKKDIHIVYTTGASRFDTSFLI